MISENYMKIQNGLSNLNWASGYSLLWQCSKRPINLKYPKNPLFFFEESIKRFSTLSFLPIPLTNYSLLINIFLKLESLASIVTFWVKYITTLWLTASNLPMNSRSSSLSGCIYPIISICISFFLLYFCRFEQQQNWLI